MEQVYTTFVRLQDGTHLSVMPGAVDLETAKDQVATVCRHFVQFPGGTQSVSVWTEKV